jgi:opacity protein-like surface antigen
MLKRTALMASSIAALSVMAIATAHAKEVNFVNPPMNPLVISENQKVSVSKAEPTTVYVVSEDVKAPVVVSQKVTIPAVQTRAPFLTTLGYENNNVSGKNGLYTAIGTETNTVVPVRLQAQGVFDVNDDWKNLSYGATAGIPFAPAQTVNLVPQIAVNRYKDLRGENGDKTLWSTGASLEYKLAPSVNVAATAMYTPDADEDKGQDSESYMFTVTKAW